MALRLSGRGALERSLIRKGLRVAGVDEVGRGCLAGPVYAACVVLDFKKLRVLKEGERSLIRDSKTLSHAQRARIIPLIQSIAEEWQVASASVDEIERHNIVGATFLAMHRCLDRLTQPPGMLLIDGKLPLRSYTGEQMTVIKGDWQCFSIAAASILAKEARDQYMREQADVFPHYGFHAHVGYGTKQHLDMIRQYGICKLHRRNFEPIKIQVTGEIEQAELFAGQDVTDDAPLITRSRDEASPAPC